MEMLPQSLEVLTEKVHMVKPVDEIDRLVFQHSVDAFSRTKVLHCCSEE